uniref:Uncharacterized protein n=1 Tax=Lepeophtheirus salmonis TaxID=72036 RepID=A0A0K2U9H9_LEPSM
MSQPPIYPFKLLWGKKKLFYCLIFRKVYLDFSLVSLDSTKEKRSLNYELEMSLNEILGLY